VSGVITDSVLFECMVQCKYTIDDPPHEMIDGKYYPITIKSVQLRGESIEPLLHISHIAMLQRRIYFKLLDEGKI